MSAIQQMLVAGGKTWKLEAKGSMLYWRSITCSSTGERVVVTSTTDMCRSTNYGDTYTNISTAANRISIAGSSDGSKLVHIITGGRVYTSTDYGTTWVARDSVRDWISVASSSDGTKLVAVVGNGYIYTSTNSGVSWTQRDSVRAWQNVTSSADGTRLAAVTYGTGGKIYLSSDSGVTWGAATYSSIRLNSIACSADGSRLIVGEGSGQVIISSDYGASWTSAITTSKFWTGVASSADGSVMVAVAVSMGLHQLLAEL